MGASDSAIFFDHKQTTNLAAQVAQVLAMSSLAIAPLRLSTESDYPPNQSQRELVKWLSNHPVKKQHFLEAYVLSSLDASSGHDTKPLDADKILGRFLDNAKAFQERTDRLLTQLHSQLHFDPSVETLRLARAAVDVKPARDRESIRDWAAHLVASITKH
jgi:hypothetical protein